MKGQLRGSLFLLAAAFVWGMAFAAQSSAMDFVEPFTFNSARAFVTAIALGIILLVKKDFSRMEGEREASVGEYLKIGGVMGVIMFVASSLQQLGLVSTTAAKSGFITALYIVLVPILGIFGGKKIGLSTWVSVLLSLIGLCLLSLRDDLSIGRGELYTLGCALAYSVHIIFIDKYAGSLNAAKLCCIQFLISGILCGLCAMVTETPDLRALKDCWVSLLYVGVMSGAVGYTLQILGQKGTDPTVASLLMCLESVFAALGGWIVLGETLLPKELLGCTMMLAACALAQIPDRRLPGRNKN